jgi:hypothetical protein
MKSLHAWKHYAVITCLIIKTMNDEKIRLNKVKSQLDHYQIYTQTKAPKGQRLSAYQEQLYNRAMFGLKMYDEESITYMHEEKRARIQHTHHKCMKVLNLWKQKVLIYKTNRFFEQRFPKAALAKHFYHTHRHKIDSNFEVTLSFTELGIDKKAIINKLIKEQVLPSNFYAKKNASKEKTMLRVQ